MNTFRIALERQQKKASMLKARRFKKGPLADNQERLLEENIRATILASVSRNPSPWWNPKISWLEIDLTHIFEQEYTIDFIFIPEKPIPFITLDAQWKTYTGEDQCRLMEQPLTNS